MRILLFTGKGGVGKTSVAAATAVRCAADGHRTLVTSTDPAHSLADALRVPVGPEPTPVAARLDAQHIDAHGRLSDHWRQIRDYLVTLLQWTGASAVEAEELALLPGMEELFSLLDLQRHAREGAYDVLVVDCAPTAETLRLLALPEVLRWYVERIFPVQQQLTRAVRPLVAGMGGVPLPPDEVFGAGQRLLATVDAVRDLLADTSTASIRLVVNPERMVVDEARRTLTYLHLFAYRVDAVIVNRVLPDEVKDPFFARWRQVQAEHLATVRDGFQGLPVYTAPLLDTEIGGLAGLARLATAVYGGTDPAAMLHATDPMQVDRDGDDLVLRLSLPFLDRSEVDVFSRSGELYVRVGGRTRAIVLPAALSGRAITGASYADDHLHVRFGRVAEVG